MLNTRFIFLLHDFVLKTNLKGKKKRLLCLGVALFYFIFLLLIFSSKSFEEAVLCGFLIVRQLSKMQKSNLTEIFDRLEASECIVMDK